MIQQQNFIALSRAIKLRTFQLICLTFQSLKYHQDQWRLYEPLHPQG